MTLLAHNPGRLIIPVGIPGCGKSTFAETFDAEVLSTDAIRQEATGDASDQSLNDWVFARFHARVAYRLALGRTVFADATNLTRDARKRLTDIAIGRGATTHVVLFKNTHEAFIRNAQRDRVVPMDVMGRMVEKYERSLLELSQERYTTITEVKSFR